jgi:TonB family protein
MRTRNPSDDKRRAIEGILNPRRSAAPDLPDGYTTTGIGLTAPPTEERSNYRAAILVAAVIIVLGVAATLLIVFRDNIARLMAIDGLQQPAAQTAVEGAIPEDTGTLSAELAGAREELAKLQGLSEANANLQRDLADKNKEIQQLRSDLADLRDRAADGDQAAGQIARLQTERDRAVQERDQAQQKNRDLEAQIIRRNQEMADKVTDQQGIVKENTQLRQTLAQREQEVEDLRDKVDGLNDDLEDVNTEYRRILKQLTDARSAGQEKDARIKELLDENSVLRQRWMASSSQSTSETTTSTVSTASGITKPRPTHRELPGYPESAIRRNVGGVVQVRVLVGTSGEVLDAEVVSSPDPLGSLDREALRAARLWRFEPATRDGVPIQVWYSIPMEFKPKS